MTADESHARYVRVGGRWMEAVRTCRVEVRPARGRTQAFCSECGGALRVGDPTRNRRFCPKCGARIERGDE